MDNNKNERCCYNTNTNGGHIGAGRSGIVGPGCIAKAVSSAKYQNQFNNNNLIEQENLMPSVEAEKPPAVMVGHNGALGDVSSDLHAKEKAFAMNGSSRNAIIPSSPSPPTRSLSVARNVSEENVPSGQQNVECLTNIITSSFTPAINGTSPGYVRAQNSGIPESILRSNNADHPLESATTAAGSVYERRDELTLEAVAKVKPDDGSGAGAPDDGDFSDNNSIGNLSYISENGLIEEIILLPNNPYSDDDNASMSDDCIYAYRGGEPGGAAGLLLELRGDQPPDDETDFLEMDFDPEPSSEMENFDTSQREQALEEDGIAANEAHLLQEARTSNGGKASHVLPLSPMVIRQDAGSSQQNEPGQLQSALEMGHAHQNQSMEKNTLASMSVAGRTSLFSVIPVVPSEKATEKRVGQAINDSGRNSGGMGNYHEPDQSVKRSQAHQTGAIPKAVPHHYANVIPEYDRAQVGRCSSNAKNLKLDLNLCMDEIDGDGGAKGRYLEHQLYYEQRTCPGSAWRDELLADTADSVKNEDFEFYCSECGKLEFTRKLWTDRKTDNWMCKNCAFMQDDKLFRRRADSFRRRTDEHEHRGKAVPSTGLRTEAEMLDIRAEQIAMEALSKINTLKETPPSGGVSGQEDLWYSRNNSTIATTDATKEQLPRTLQDQEVPNPDFYQHGVGAGPEKTVTIYTINCGELTIIGALARIGVAPNLEVLRQFFNEQYEVDTSKMNIPQYLLHMSKRDCNYKKLIEAIKSCCADETLDVQYYPIDPFCDMPEIVHINSGEIAKRWNANTNLRQIIHFKHKHFHTLNVLGKVVNIIRQPSRGRHTTHMIGIPQYYKSGSITITRVTEGSPGSS